MYHVGISPCPYMDGRAGEGGGQAARTTGGDPDEAGQDRGRRIAVGEAAGPGTTACGSVSILWAIRDAPFPPLPPSSPRGWAEATAEAEPQGRLGTALGVGTSTDVSSWAASKSERLEAPFLQAGS